MSEPTVLVTGASRGIGLATVRALLEVHSANVIAVSRNGSAELDELAGIKQGGLLITHGDVGKDEDNKAALEAGMRMFSRLDAIILNAGVVEHQRIGDIDIEATRQLFDINVISIFSSVKHALPYLRQNNGRIIVVSSGAATGGTSSWGAYSASKAAVNSIVKTLANEETDVTAVAIRPGTVATAMQKKIRDEAGGHMSSSELKRFTDLHENDKLILPDVTGGILANLALKAKHDLSGQFVSWDDAEMKEYRR